MCPFRGRELDPHLTQCGLGRAYLLTKWNLDPSSRLATIDMGRKVAALSLFRGSWSPSNTMWPGPRPTFVPSGILIHPTVCQQYTNVTDRQGIGRTVYRSKTGQVKLSPPAGGRPRTTLYCPPAVRAKSVEMRAVSS